jgi:hypothetical protein
MQCFGRDYPLTVSSLLAFFPCVSLLNNNYNNQKISYAFFYFPLMNVLLFICYIYVYSSQTFLCVCLCVVCGFNRLKPEVHLTTVGLREMIRRSTISHAKLLVWQ